MIIFFFVEGVELEEFSGEVDGEFEVWGLVDVRELYFGFLVYRVARIRDLFALVAVLVYGVEVNWVDSEDEGKTSLV